MLTERPPILEFAFLTVEAAMEAVRKDLLDSNSNLNGSVRVLIPDGFASYVINPCLARMRLSQDWLSSLSAPISTRHPATGVAIRTAGVFE